MKITAETPRKNITIASIIFSAPMPYEPGPRELTDGEADTLNQALHENARNNFATRVKTAQEEATKAGTAVDEEKLKAEFEAYVAEYEFGVRRVSAGSSVTDPVEAEALSMANKVVRDALRQQGFKIKQVPAEKIEELAQAMLVQYPSIREQAKIAVEARKAVGQITMEALNLPKPEAAADQDAGAAAETAPAAE